MKPDICIYHAPCPDDFTAAWAVEKRCGEDVTFVHGVYGKRAVPLPDVAGRHVLFVDFSYRTDVLEAIATHAKSVTVLDHHKSAQAELESFAVLNPVSADDIDDVIAATQPGLGNIRAIFDMEKSGARLAWEFCFPGEPIPRLVAYVEDRDLWRFALPHSRDVNAYILAHEYGFGTWQKLADDLETDSGIERAIARGEAINKKHFRDLDELLRLTRRPMVIGGHTVEAANIPYTMASDAAGILAKHHPFGATYYDRNDGKRVFSLRSGPGGVDVSLVARTYGGGGHRNAAGFEVPWGWEGDGSTARGGGGE